MIRGHVCSRRLKNPPIAQFESFLQPNVVFSVLSPDPLDCSDGFD